jgi:amphi-Trp domain-containing protein
MKRKKRTLVKTKGMKSTGEVANLLHKIAGRVEAKKIRFIQGELDTEVELPDEVLFTLRAKESETKKKGLERCVNFTIRWRDGEEKHEPIDVK